MRLTKQTSYAVRILLRCPKNDEGYVRASDIAGWRDNRYNVLKIMPLLARAGFITTNRGRTGGVKLARPACEIDLGDVFRATKSTHIEKEFAGGRPRSLKNKRLSPVSMMLDKAMRRLSVRSKGTHSQILWNCARQENAKTAEPDQERSPRVNHNFPEFPSRTTD